MEQAQVRETGIVSKHLEDGQAYIATPQGDRVWVMRRDIKSGGIPDVGTKVSFIRNPIYKFRPDGSKLSDQALDVEVL